MDRCVEWWMVCGTNDCVEYWMLVLSSGCWYRVVDGGRNRWME